MTTQTVTLHDVLPLVERLSPTDKSHLLNILNSSMNEDDVALSQSRTADEAATRRERVQAFRGKYRDSLTSTEELLRIKHEGTEREEQSWRTMSREERIIQIDRVFGKYADVQTSSDDFAREKQAEIDLEERRWQHS